MLKNVYFYWNAVHPQPCPTMTSAPVNYTTAIHQVKPAAVVEPTTFAKVASTFWSVRPVQLGTTGILKYWKDDKDFTVFATERYSENKGVLYKDGVYNYCLLDGGDNFQRGQEFVGDNDGNRRWIDAVSKSMKATGLSGFLPTAQQSRSITKMLGNRMSVFFEPYYSNTSRNMLGLDWPKGYFVISHPRQKLAATPQRNDPKGVPVITDDVGEARVLRLSASGTDLMLDYPEYVRAFNYSDQDYFKFFPLYITIYNFGKYAEK
jgi:hypothetical protein